MADDEKLEQQQQERREFLSWLGGALACGAAVMAGDAATLQAVAAGEQTAAAQMQPMHLVASTPNAHRCLDQSYPGIAGLGGICAAAVCSPAATASSLPASPAMTAAPHARAPPSQLRNSRRSCCCCSSFSSSAILRRPLPQVPSAACAICTRHGRNRPPRFPYPRRSSPSRFQP